MANYKTSWVQRLIEGAWQKTFAFAHAKTVYTDFANKKTLADKLSEIDTEIGNKANKTEIPTELPANGGNSATVNGHTVKSDVPENAVFTDTVYDDTEVQKRISDNGYGEVSGGKSLIQDKNMNNLLSQMSDNADGTTHSYADGVLTVNRIANVNSGVYVYNSIFRRFDNKKIKISFDAKSSVDGMVLSISLNDSALVYTTILTSDYKRYSVEVQARGTQHNFIIYGNAVAGEVDIKNVMLSEAIYNNTSYEPYFPSNKMLAAEKADKSETTVNLLNPTLETTTVNGVTCTNNGDGTYTISGTSTAQVTFKLAVNVKVPISCILTGCKGGSPTTYMFGVFDGANYFEVYDIDNAKEIHANTYRYAYIVVRSGVTIPDNTIITPIITTNLDATYDDFVPYTGDSGSLNGDVAEKAPKANPVFTGSISMGRKAGTTVGKNSTAEGSNTTAIGSFSHAEGYETTVIGYSSHAEGYRTTASEDSSHAEGYGTTALACQHAGGHHNNTTVAINSVFSGTGTGTSFVIGNGTSSSKSNAFRVDDNGTPYSKAGLNTTGADYAEFFEWEDGNENNEDRRGYFVTLDGKHIKIAKEGDWILGIVSGFPAIIGNGDEEWKGRYVFDDFGCPVIEEFEYEEEEYETITNADGKEEVITKKVKKTGTKWKEVPDYDPTQPYTGRMQRKEWAAIGMLGVLSVRDDGSCKVNGFCKLADGGIATDSDTGYRVVKRVTDNIVEVIFK